MTDRGVRRVVAACAVGVCVFGSPEMLTGAQTSDSGLVLALQSDTRTYAETEPIILSVSVRNDGATAFEDMATLNPQVGYLTLIVTAATGRLRQLGAIDVRVFTEPGMTLFPGEKVCRVINLLDHFGPSISRDANYLRSLGPGVYRVRALFNAHLAAAGEQPAVHLTSNTLTLTVRDPGTLPMGDRELLNIVKTIRDRKDGRDRVRVALGAHPRPGYVLLAGLQGYITEEEMPTDSLVANPGRYGLSALQAAALIRFRYGGAGDGAPARRAWLRHKLRHTKASELRCVLHTLDREIDERAKYRDD